MSLFSRCIAWIALPLWTLLCIAWSTMAQASQYGCSGLEALRDAPSIEGTPGVFFRIQSDLRMDHRFTDEAVALLGDLSSALAARGTQLIYVPVPTKSLAMPHALPDQARLYGYDWAVARLAFADVIMRLERAGVASVDAVASLSALPLDQPAFFAADFHWTAYGARATAQDIARRMAAIPEYVDLPKTSFVTQQTAVETAFSGLRRKLQKHCHKALPRVQSPRFETRENKAEGGVVDLFGASSSAHVVLVGTSFSDSEINNFSGFIAQYTGLETRNYALTGGNQFGAIEDYLTSEDFATDPPAFLIWENPIYNSLTRFSDQPMRALIAAVSGGCDEALPAAVQGEGLHVTLPDAVSADASLFLHVPNTPARRFEFHFETAKGRRSKILTRTDRQTLTGRYFLPLSGLQTPHRVTVKASGGLGPKSRVYLCPDLKGKI